MLRALAIHERLLTFGKSRRVEYFFQSNQKNSYSIARIHGSLVKFGVPSSLCRSFSQYKVPCRGFDTFGKYQVKEKAYKRYYVRNFCVLSVGSSSVTHHAQLALKRLNLRCSYSIPTFAPVNKIACAVSLAFNRFQLVPGILALIVGEVSWTQRIMADGEYFPAMDGLYMRAQGGQVYFNVVIFSMLEVAVLIFRAVFLGVLFLPAIAMAPFADSFGISFRKAWLHLVHLTLEKAGPAFIKWGQWAATRPDLFPNDLCKELQKLHTGAPTHSFAYSKKTIEKAFGRTLTEIFENFEEAPIASGSIAQVHRASLRSRYPGLRLRKPIEVAVKVRHPGVGETIRRDFMIINLVAKISKFIPALNWLRLDESVRQFAVFMMSQVDLAREAANLNRFIHNFRRKKDVSFPKPIYPLVHPAVLVETYEAGENVSYYLELEGNAQLKRDLARIGTDAFLKMLLADNFVHADMHPGNILVRVPQKKPSSKKLFKARPHIIFIDVGMTVELSKSDRDNLIEFFKAVSLRDGRTAAECTLRLSKQQSCPNPKAFIEELERTFTFWGTREGDIFHPVECMHQLLEQVRRHRVNVDGNVCTVLVTILVLESWQRKLDPEYDILHKLRTLVLRADGAQPIDYFFS